MKNEKLAKELARWFNPSTRWVPLDTRINNRGIMEQTHQLIMGIATNDKAKVFKWTHYMTNKLQKHGNSNLLKYLKKANKNYPIE